MITYSIIKKSQLEGALRLDAEYYQPEYFIDFTKGDWRPIVSFLKNCQYGLSQAMNDNKKGYPMFKMDNIDYAFLFDDDVRYADIKEKIFSEFELEKNDVLFNRVNSEEFVGRTGIFKLDLKSTFASYLIRLQVGDDSEILPDYLNIFLNSKYGLRQIKKNARRAVNQANVNAEELKQIKIPVLPIKFQKEIEKLSNESWNNFKLSKKFYSEAESLLLEELGLNDFENKESLFSIVNLSDVKNADRIDAEYFQAKYENLISRIKNYKNGFDSFDNLIEISNEKIEVNPEEEYKYIELADVNQNLGIIDNIQKIKGKELPSRAKMKLQKNDVIVSSVEGSTNKVALITEDMVDLVGSTGFFILKGKYFNPEVNLILIKSVIIKSLLMREAQGTILTAIPSSSLKRIILPKLASGIQQEIAELVRKSHQSRKKAKELLEEAKQKVEKLIEG